ncbi:MAG: HlyD family secretion protein [Cardiobacterium sp.]
MGREGAAAAIDNAKAMLAPAEQELGHTTVYAPADGQLGEVAVKIGQLVSAGTQLMSVVPAARWIVANIKETDMKNIRSGQQADITVDALGGAHFSGTIGEIAPATTSEFSIIKADSGTGNFVKIAQRIAVKIELHPGQADLRKLAPRMSVEVRIDTRQK